MKSLIISIAFLFPFCCFSQTFKYSIQPSVLIMDVDYVGYSSSGSRDKSFSDHIDKPYYYRVKEKTFLGNLGVNVGFDWPIKKIRINGKDASIGLSHNATFGVLVSKFPGLNNIFAISVPNYLMFKTGINSSKDAEGKSGFGFGLGHNLQIMPFRFLNNYKAIIEYSISKSFFNLSIDINRPTIHTMLSSEGLIPSFKYRTISIGYGRYIK